MLLGGAAKHSSGTQHCELTTNELKLRACDPVIVSIHACISSLVRREDILLRSTCPSQSSLFQSPQEWKLNSGNKQNPKEGKTFIDKVTTWIDGEITRDHRGRPTCSNGSAGL